MGKPLITVPQKGEKVSSLWRHVAANARAQAASASELAALTGTRQPRRPMDVTGSGAVRWVEIDGIADLGSDKVSVELDGESVDAAIPYLLRTAPTANHFRMPEFAAGQWVAIVQPVEGTGIVGVTWLVLEEGRNWAATLEICDGLYADFVMSPTRETP
jgi:hypothetical protein